MNSIRNIFKSNDIRTIAQNYFSLSLLQLANYLLPLITLPYLTRILGPEKFGLIAFAQAVIQYLMLITDFGFNISATKAISLNRNDNKKLNSIFSSVIYIKLILVIITFLCLLLLILIFNKFKSEQIIYYYFYLGIIGWVLFPQWLFQGLEKMGFITLFNIIAKFFFTVSIFIFIRGRNDYELVALINSIGYLISGFGAFFYSLSVLKIKFILPSFSEIKEQFLEGWYLFISSISTNLYTSTNSIILGIFTNDTLVGYYTAAEKLIKAILFLGTPLHQALFPFMSKIYSDNKNKAMIIFSSMIKNVAIISFVLSLLLCLFSNYIISALFGNGYSESKIIFAILAWVVFFGMVNYTLGIQCLVNMGYEKIFSKIVFLCSIVHIILLMVMIPIIGEVIVPIQWVITEIIIGIFLYKYFVQIKDSSKY